jgi:putative nucleotidyltransferase with HDIG domain
MIAFTMRPRIRRPRGEELYALSQVVLLVGSLAGAALVSGASDWHPIAVVVMLGVLAIATEAITVQLGNIRLSVAFIALALAMVLLGPAPAVAIAVTATVIDGFWTRKRPLPFVSNLATFACFPLVGGLLARALLAAGGTVAGRHLHALVVAFVVCVVYAATNLLNFALIASYFRVMSGRSLLFQARNMFVPMLPSEAAALVLTAMLAATYASTNNSSIVLGGLILAVGPFAMLVRALARSEDRADQLAARSSQLAHLQVGVLSTLLETLALRDPATSHHGAAVARLARALAGELSLSEREQDLVHTAGLLHDIGKFALPDRILHAAELSEDDRALVRRHCQDGAALVGRLDGYGPVAEIILYHHERVDGTGYPAGLIGREIPVLARIIAVCETYDTLTGRDSYRTPVTPVEAFIELRRVAGRQLDADLVDSLIVMLQRDSAGLLVSGEVQGITADDEFARLAQAMAQP